LGPDAVFLGGTIGFRFFSTLAVFYSGSGSGIGHPLDSGAAVPAIGFDTHNTSSFSDIYLELPGLLALNSLKKKQSQKNSKKKKTILEKVLVK